MHISLNEFVYAVCMKGESLDLAMMPPIPKIVGIGGIIARMVVL